MGCRCRFGSVKQRPMHLAVDTIPAVGHALESIIRCPQTRSRWFDLHVQSAVVEHPDPPRSQLRHARQPPADSDGADHVRLVIGAGVVAAAHADQPADVNLVCDPVTGQSGRDQLAPRHGIHIPTLPRPVSLRGDRETSRGQFRAAPSVEDSLVTQFRILRAFRRKSRPEARPILNCEGSDPELGKASSRGDGEGPGDRSRRALPRRGAAQYTRRSARADHFTSASTQSIDLVTAFFQRRSWRARSSASRFGSQRLSSCQLAARSSRPDQKPTARPAA